ncbi:lytic transglycosylase domain-containing protein [Luteimonas kalidii]|uniref:Lytic transglycosylase domain-containing protein n=1 Tax=Luteimonas kalidii TaxID=3042025 RepID=A0ABT6JXC0_9GAMM|nr:lytic transglycosylase domain-containing protein [Luteimonas kalidii]MDH5835342.1 lytic transglycosylase domain-containing protein [Luteimonas kalidii]
MKRLACAVLLAAAVAAPAHGCGLAQWQPHIAEASRRYAVPEAWIRAVMRAESAGCTQLDGRPITSHAGAMGLMQIMPATWADLRRRHGLGDDPHDPRENILAGTAYLRELADRFGVPGAFAAYHAGPGRYAAHLQRGASLPAETRRYLAQVSAAAGIDGAPQVAGTADAPIDPLFAIRRANAAASAGMPASTGRLFMPLRHAQPPAETAHVQP